MKSVLITIAILIACQTAKANCSYDDNLDLREIQPKVFQRLKIKDQKFDGLCYSFTGSALIDFYRYTHGATGYSTISPIEAAMYTRIDKEMYSTNGGQICEVVNSLSKRGYGCSSDQLDQIDTNDKKIKELASFIHVEMVTKVYQDYLIKNKNYNYISKSGLNNRSNLSKDQKDHLKRFDDSYNSFLKHFHQLKLDLRILPSKEDLFLLTQEVHIKKRYITLQSEFAELMLSKHCGHKISIPSSIQCENIYDTPILISEIHKSLDTKRAIAISYCSQVLYNKELVGIHDGVINKATCDLHASLIIGKKFDSHSGCSYLIRNSWGQKKDYDWKTSDGDIWVSEKALKNNLYGVHKIK